MGGVVPAVVLPLIYMTAAQSQSLQRHEDRLRIQSQAPADFSKGEIVPVAKLQALIDVQLLQLLVDPALLPLLLGHPLLGGGLPGRGELPMERVQVIYRRRLLFKQLLSLVPSFHIIDYNFNG